MQTRTKRLIMSLLLGAIYGLFLGVAIHASLFFTNTAAVARYGSSFEFEISLTVLCALVWFARAWFETREA